ncbi:inorganic phosphate transporter [Terracoccus luteus]|jgi:PiT family inorganic phosphate transporter|uniref:PiT family inorganic phosphate transporter n=1 Tax=Terracoccus luteus TaxID=53356 RepID=A0A495XSA2_9MICO|nr:inorganic phosphate transporter [Terracoccus luteus]MBB2986732.1 PiT family inorganic phosphate transporter [Terracoccus luteus]MCP2172383.1 PiT family inorganic phosphate transporter [Terracoccus luteus]RKT76782.1 PiT family inorganic phosphate transporter [Terracoccus luteus]
MDSNIPLLGVVAVVALAMGFNYTNGFHDAANAIATSISTRALTPRIALAMAAVANLVGAFFGTKVAQTIGSGIIAQPQGVNGLWLVAAALVGAIGWNLLTWWFGLPSSSSHALIGGLGGAALVAGVSVQWSVILQKVVIPMVISPFAGLVLGYLVMVAILWLFRNANPGRVTRGFRMAQTASAAAMAFGHGLQDAAKTAGVVVLALNISGHHDDESIPLWVLVLSAIVISAGTYAGGWRIMRTLGRRIIDLQPPQGFAAETTAAAILYVAGLSFGAPISTTHTITSAIMGVGATKRLSAVRWSVAGNIVGAWFLTFPGAALVAVLTWWVTSVFR